MSDVERWLEGTHAIVTGASRGIGLAIAAGLARRGASVTIMARSADLLAAQTARLTKEGLRVTPIVCDVSNETSVRDAFERAGPAYVLVNNAGIASARSFLETTRAVWDETIAVNLTGVYLCSMQALPAMLAAASGRIVNVASTAGLRGFKNMTAYSASKHGVIGLTRALAMETAKHGVTVNAVCPGYVETDLVEQGIRSLVAARGVSREEARDMLLRPIPTGRFTTAEEVSSAVEWLASPNAANVTGVALPLAGGEVQ